MTWSLILQIRTTKTDKKMEESKKSRRISTKGSLTQPYLRDFLLRLSLGTSRKQWRRADMSFTNMHKKTL